ncbi:GIY-YIG nuclease family protein [Parvibaculum sp.]|jgi:putative endonuclease|uniref:GIY-YIG nuclease family protein n=1 Tax=Parvibaculum sp. TaxID=2024848 RepID=UPI001B00E087|nr:GIY-YIG nuclease family protein [Parvibaculum sp.]MBO6633625.1 GIY-YIG nuclease family protein [Parvibaculum sp.]MBO6679572.1 GIY-YIG nuclease family protein [Parvibaculum sp.]MBO6686069.1 GIY-YIG nuclease family protein [Parvibaculum sp.]
MAENGGHAPTPWYLYILECAGGRLYTGIAIDVDARFEAHLAGRGAKFTRSYPPERILLIRQYSSRGEALREEIAVKKLSSTKKWHLIRTAAGATLHVPCPKP